MWLCRPSHSQAGRKAYIIAPIFYFTGRLNAPTERLIMNITIIGTDPGVINRTFLALFGVAVVLALATAARYFCITLLGERSLASLRSRYSVQPLISQVCTAASVSR